VDNCSAVLDSKCTIGVIYRKIGVGGDKSRLINYISKKTPKQIEK
jgi:hypothetical protein